MRKKLLFISGLLTLGFGASAQTILGLDVSSYEGNVNWVSVKAAGYSFAFAKATEGVTITDSYFVTNETNSAAAGIPIGAYHFAHPEDNTATAEANYFLSVAGSYIKSCALPPVLDLEDPPTGPSLSSYFTRAQLTAWVQTWMSTVQAATGIAPIIYIGPSNAAYVDSSINVYGLWIDDYNSNPHNPPPNIGVWTNWDFKQYSWTGTVPGISGSSNVDLDVFHGDTAAFNTFVGCATVNAAFNANIRSVCPGGSVNFTDKSSSTGTITAWKWSFPGGSPTTSTAVNPTITYNTPGTYNVKEVVTSTTGKDSTTSVGYITVVSTASLPLQETFQSSTFPPTGWILNKPNPYDSVWELCTTNGYNSSQCMYFPANCGSVTDISGERQQLYTPDYSFASVANAEMSFDVAYEPSKVPTYSDTLVVYYSLDCGNTWKSIYSKGGMTLCTTGGTTSAGDDTAGSHGDGCFVPPSDLAWRRDSINLSALNGQASVMFSFESRSGWGNIIYLDNINVPNTLTSIPDITENNNVKIYPNPNNGSFTIAANGNFTEKAQVEIYDALGQQIYRSSITSGFTQVNLNTKTAGVYFYRIVTEENGQLISEGKLLIQ